MNETGPIDHDATPATRALLERLAAGVGEHVLFGHQDTLATGQTWAAEPGRSDVLDVTGRHAAVAGFDVGRIELGADANIDGVRFDDMVRLVREAHERGQIVTISWHSVNPITEGGYADNLAPDSIARVLHGGDRHSTLLDWLDRFAAFNARLVDADGERIPYVFRPYHEHTGDWFWWGLGAPGNTPEQYAALWHTTFDYLRGRGVHNVLWSLSPDRSRISLDRFESDFLAGYPGDAYVDVLGLDDYRDLGRAPVSLEQQRADLIASLEGLVAIADARGKIAALTEAGVAHSASHPWTGHLLPALKASPATRRVAWALFWRNAPDSSDAPWIPLPGTHAGDDLARMAEDPFVRFGPAAD
ncbi:MAG: hypothetical protein GX593_07185 [Actinomycetales bacterium]|nr:hypothetical protein [Actinomycetales bacterium]